MAELRHTLICANMQKTSSWSGGETTEIAIFPCESNYLARDFAWRISSATITASESDFTLLPGYMRHLMILDGKIEFIHNNEIKFLGKYDTVFFDGATSTKSKGICKDFNLILADGWKGSLSLATANEKTQSEFTGFYSLCDDVTVKLDGLPDITLNQYDFLLIEGLGIDYILRTNDTQGDCVILMEISREGYVKI